ncbi:EVE domain-containing protein [Coxiella-like endosymbiont]|uniref:EVE domain-containing protein n=1 Tax=Coxiella-like endosymbiont TaxID=1592897 RepID=UPI00272A250D|nr:EVE domain-containing protein [Coxiella-like endosymbiont]
MPEKSRWFTVDIQFEKKFDRNIKLEELRRIPRLKDVIILGKDNRLSITSITKTE